MLDKVLKEEQIPQSCLLSNLLRWCPCHPPSALRSNPRAKLNSIVRVLTHLWSSIMRIRGCSIWQVLHKNYSTMITHSMSLVNDQSQLYCVIVIVMRRFHKSNQTTMSKSYFTYPMNFEKGTSLLRILVVSPVYAPLSRCPQLIFE